jgi:Domain of unknown function (DUF6745)
MEAGSARLVDATEIPDGYRVDGPLRIDDASKIRRVGRCELGGSLRLSRCHALTVVDGAAARNGLSLEGALHLEALPDGLRVDGDLVLANCPRLRALPRALSVQGSLVIRACPRLASIPEGTRVEKNLTITGWNRLGELPRDLFVGGAVILQSTATTLPSGFVVNGNLAWIGCVALERLPEGLRVKGDLLVRRCPKLSALPRGVVVEGGLEARFASFRALPDDLSIGAYIDLEGCGRLTALPEGLRAPYSLSLRRCTRLESLPRGLVVGEAASRGAGWRRWRAFGWHYGNVGPSASRVPLTPGLLDLTNCLRLTELPADIVVHGQIEVAGSAIKSAPAHVEEALLWRRVRVPARVAFHPESFAAAEVFAMPNVELRRVLLEMLGPERLLERLSPEVVHEDVDLGGPRRLLRIRSPLSREPYVFLECRCPSTGRTYVLRVPPTTTTCHAAAAWTAGFDNPDDYKPLYET